MVQSTGLTLHIRERESKKERERKKFMPVLLSVFMQAKQETKRKTK